VPAHLTAPTVTGLPSTQWATRMLASLGCLGWRTLPPPSKKLHVVTGCSGTDAPIVALAQIFGDTFKDCIHHTASAERSKVMRDWISANFDVPHIFSDIADFNGPLDDPCHLDLYDTDLFIAGFPCTPFSVMNQSRFKRGYDPFSEAAARPFFEIVKLMKHPNPLRRPKCLILENVPGANMKLPGPDSDDESSSGTAQTPLDFILNGTVNGEHWGLANQDHYICGWCVLQASAQGLPQSRRRLYFLVFRTDVMDRSMLDAALSMLTATSGQLPRGSLDDFLNPSTLCIRGRSAGSRHRAMQQHSTESTGSNLATERCLPKWVADHAAFRASRGLPPASSPDGRPFSSLLDADGQHTLGLSLRCLDICDIVKLLHPDRDDVIIDVSQSIARQSWRYHDRCQTCLA
jgi:site-specific DNA-cytosine methylase